MDASHRYAPPPPWPGWVKPVILLVLASAGAAGYWFLWRDRGESPEAARVSPERPASPVGDAGSGQDDGPEASADGGATEGLESDAADDGVTRPATPPADDGGAAPAGVFQTGLDVLLSDPEAAAPLRGKRLALITNRASVTCDGRPGFRALQEARIGELVAVLTPEHGFLADREGKGAAGLAGFDGAVFALYGKDLRPTPEMLSGVEVLVYDLQDVGVRFYTYVSTLALCMEAARKAGLPFVVLDRPDPIAPQGTGGGVLESGLESFVGLLPVPLRYGLTPGEMATHLARRWPARFGARLQVVRMRGYRHGLWFDDLGRDWIPPSPSVIDFATALSYPGFCLFEGTNLALGRGTAWPFQLVAAPWLKAGPIAEAVRPLAAELGAELQVETVTPMDPADDKFGGKTCRAIRVIVRDRARYEPIRLALGLLQEIRRRHPKALRFRDEHFDRLAGTAELRERLERKRPLAPLLARWRRQLEDFEIESRAARLYPR